MIGTWKIMGTEQAMGIYEALTRAGVATIEAEYYGSGDEGYIDTITMFDVRGNAVDNKDALEMVERFIYDHLPGGFEINEGSQGTVEIDVISRKAHFDHNENEMISHNRPYDVEDNG
jgi:hypothetical protein